MSRINRILTVLLGIFLISSGIAKFAGGHVFQYIEHRSGLDIFYPYVNHLVGLTEIAAGGLVLFRRTRLIGGVLASGVLAGAVAFHLSPWLGVSMPTGLVDGAAAPWTEADFSSSTTSATFVIAIVTLVRSLQVVRTELRGRRDAERSASETDLVDRAAPTPAL